jgi:hypothetical protein
MLALPFVLGPAMASRQKTLTSAPVEWQLRPTSARVEAIRHALLSVLDDCRGVECDRLRWRVHTAECAQELWLLRDAVFQAVSAQHCQQQAEQRLHELVPAFRELLSHG